MTRQTTSIRRGVSIVSVLAAALLSSGCGLLSRSSISVSSLSMSFSASSSAQAVFAEAPYQKDVAAATVAYLDSGSEAADPFLRDVGRIDLEHGIVDWGAQDATYTAIGAGLRAGGLDEPGARLFVARVFPENPRAGEQISESYATPATP